MKTKYVAQISGNTWEIGPSAGFNSIQAVKKWAGFFGKAAEKVSVYNGTGDLVSVYSRKGPGLRWYRGTL